MGCDIVDNLLAEWHKHFVIQERMLKVNCSILTPEPVLKASGHVDKFADFMVKDEKTGECFRLDHLIKQSFEKILLDKKTKPEEKEKISRKLALLEGMTMVSLFVQNVIFLHMKIDFCNIPESEFVIVLSLTIDNVTYYIYD
ncbi:UNVERIFIED_CONTAM: hypothetical protein GTU68_055916 [Idotea baltica]|nr:hypothetical protein [Idotea baltica]